uniref:Interleukin-36 alpha n=1 Tax=Mus musculus TaxID=10090 RepID=A0A0G2SSZ4_MOUSE|nr:interleukin-36 alpha [Mus musculus]
MNKEKELRAASPSLRHVQDLSSRVWILQNNILTAVPRKEQTVPGREHNGNVQQKGTCKSLSLLSQEEWYNLYI